MPTPLRRGLRRARRGGTYLVAGVLVAMAVFAIAFSQLLAMAERNPQRIADWLSARAGRPVAFDHVETQWTRRGPLLRLDGLRVGEAGGVAIGEAEILVAQYAGLLPGRSFTELRLRGLELALQRDADGSWRVRGLPGQQDGADDPLDALEGLGELQVVHSRLTVLAPALGIETTLPRADLRLRVEGDRVRAAARAWMREGASPLDIVLDFDRKRGDGRVYAALLQADLSAWSSVARHAGIVAESGHGQVRAWGVLRAHRIVSVTTEGALRDIVVRGAPLEAGRDAPRLRIAAIDTLARLRAAGDDWRIDAPRLRVADGARTQVLDGLQVAGGARTALHARRIDAGPLVVALALSDRLDPGLRSWLLASSPDAVLHDVDVAGTGSQRLRAQARIEGLRFDAVGDTPGMSGLQGELSGDAAGFAFVFDPAARVRFDWAPAFGAPHDIRLAGRVAGWRDGEGMRIETSALRVDGDGYDADLRGGLTFQGDGTRPVMDLAAAIAPAKVPVAKRFWVRHHMADAAERWLDAALVDGTVRNGRALVSGDLDDWPFSARDGHQARGLFHAEGELVDTVVKFQPDWPAAENLDGLARFVNDGFTVRGRGAIAGVEVTALEAGLAHYGQAELTIRADTRGDAGRLLALLRQSPLHAAHADTLDNLSASGPVAAGFAMALPLQGTGHAPRISGDIELQGATLADARWKLAFDEVRGRARYDQAGFGTDGLQVQRDGRPGTLSLRAGDSHVRDAAHAFEAELDAVLPAADLLAQAPDLAWLSPHVTGRSRWTVAVSIPQAAGNPAAAAGPGARPAAVSTRLQLRSDLVGTTLDLPLPLRKAPGTPLATTVSTTLPFEGGDVAVAFGNRLALRAGNTNGGTGVRVLLGTSDVPAPPSVPGLVVGGRTSSLEAMDWAMLSGGDGSGEGLALRSLDITADTLQLLGSRFADTRITAAPDGDATRIAFEGVALAGTLRLPRARTAPVVGRLQRLHWTSSKPLATVGTAPKPVAAPDPGNEVDPARIPPLQIDVEDFRFGTLSLGQTSFRSRPTAAGLEIERLQARSDTQRIDASGRWTGRGAQARTHLRVDIASEDFGALLDGFGFGKRIAGGDGTLRFDAGWPRSPAGFDVGLLDGTLSATVKDGKLVEVEPGAGRVLGLLSVAEIPRRLMLDFRDFFTSGFAFNRMGGNVRFSGGQAQSDDIVIDGPAAELRIQGRSDLRAQTHDQRIDVLPKTGNLLTAVGAIAGGPVGAAVGAVANAVLRKPLGQLNAKTYRVTGTWQDPKVEVTDHDPAPRAQAPAVPAIPATPATRDDTP